MKTRTIALAALGTLAWSALVALAVELPEPEPPPLTEITIDVTAEAAPSWNQNLVRLDPMVVTPTGSRPATAADCAGRCEAWIRIESPAS